MAEMAKSLIFYFFALAYHVFAFLIVLGIWIDMGDSNSNWDGPSYKGGNGVFKKDDGTWYNVFQPSQAITDPETNTEATAELLTINVALSITALDTVVTILYRCFNRNFGEHMFFNTWDGDAKEDSFYKARKALRAAGVFGAYLAAFLWACGFTAAFNSRPIGTVLHDPNPLTENSSYFVAFMVTILVTILPMEDDGGYLQLWD